MKKFNLHFVFNISPKAFWALIWFHLKGVELVVTHVDQGPWPYCYQQHQKENLNLNWTKLIKSKFCFDQLSSVQIQIPLLILLIAIWPWALIIMCHNKFNPFELKSNQSSKSLWRNIKNKSQIKLCFKNYKITFVKCTIFLGPL